MRLRGKIRALALLVLAAALVLSSCGSNTSTTPKVSTLVRTSPVHSAPPSGPSGPAGPAGKPVGTTQRVPATGTTLLVAVTRVLDPLRGSGAKVPAGMTPVGVLIRVRNAGPGSYDSSYTSDFALLSPAGHAVPVFAPTGVCQTYVQDFMNELSPGVSRTGCIAYVLPRGTAPSAVRLSPDGGTAHHSVSWVVR